MDPLSLKNLFDSKEFEAQYHCNEALGAFPGEDGYRAREA